MNRLHPELKRLMKWAQPAAQPSAESAPADAPLGFSGRVVARWSDDHTPSPLVAWQRAIWFASWIAAGLIVGGAAWFMVDQQPVSTAHDFVTVYQVFARSIVP